MSLKGSRLLFQQYSYENKCLFKEVVGSTKEVVGSTYSLLGLFKSSSLYHAQKAC